MRLKVKKIICGIILIGTMMGPVVAYAGHEFTTGGLVHANYRSHYAWADYTHHMVYAKVTKENRVSRQIGWQSTATDWVYLPHWCDVYGEWGYDTKPQGYGYDFQY